MAAHDVVYGGDASRWRYPVAATATRASARTAADARTAVARDAHRAAGVPPYRSLVAQTAALVSVEETTRDGTPLDPVRSGR